MIREYLHGEWECIKWPGTSVGTGNKDVDAGLTWPFISLEQISQVP